VGASVAVGMGVGVSWGAAVGVGAAKGAHAKRSATMINKPVGARLHCVVFTACSSRISYENARHGEHGEQ
jgi:hypothetical protein